MLPTLLSMFALALASPASPAPTCTEGMGTVRLERHSSSDGMLVKRCTAVLVTEDAVLLPASCFDWVRDATGSLSAYNFDATFTPASAPEQTVLLGGFAIHPDFAPILCERAADAELCARAQDYCIHTRVGMDRDICLYDSASYARTYLQGPSHNIAVGYLVRPLTVPTVAVFAPATPALAAKEMLTMVHPVQPTFASVALRHTAFELVLANDVGMRALPFACGTAAGQCALVALPSHFTALPYAVAAPVDRTFTRVDAALGWLDGALQQAFERGERVSDAAIVRLEAKGPAVPEPKVPAEPEPDAPQPQPAPAPQPTPAVPPLAHPPAGQSGQPPADGPQQTTGPQDSADAPDPLQEENMPLAPPDSVTSPVARGCGGHAQQLHALLLLPLCRRRRSSVCVTRL